MNNERYFETAMLAGEIELRSGSEISRVEDTMERILALSENGHAEVYATTTGIIASLAVENKVPLTGVKRIAARANNLNHIYQVNNISRALCSGKIDVEDAYQKLQAVRTTREHPRWLVHCCSVLAVMGCSTLFGGNLYDFFLSAIPAVFMVILDLLMVRRVYIDFMKDFLKAMGSAFLSMLVCYLFPDANSGVVTISALMPLVPGIPITNAIRDTLQGDYMSGVSRMLEALVISLGIAAGAGAGLGVFHLLERWGF